MISVPAREVKIVIAESTAQLAKVYTKFLEGAGVKVLATFSNAKDMISSIRADSDKFSKSIVLVGSSLSETDGGPRALAYQLRQVNPNQKIILVMNDPSPMIELDKKLFDATICKPFTISELMGVIEKIASPVLEKGSTVVNDPKEIEGVIRHVLTESHEKLCSVRNPSTIQKGLNINGHTPTFVSAISKGLKVFIVTEITKDNLSYCKQLMMNRGIQLRHIEDIVPNFSVWDGKFVTEVVQGPTKAYPLGHLFYSNLESDVARCELCFDRLWAVAVPAEVKIREMEKSDDTGRITVVTGIDEIIKARVRMIRDAQVSLDLCTVPEFVYNYVIPKLGQEYSDAISRGVRARIIYDIRENGILYCKELIDLGFEVRHLPNVGGMFSLSEKGILAGASSTDGQLQEDTKAIFSDFPDFVKQHQSMFETLWNTAVPASERLMEILGKGQPVQQL